MGQYGLLATGTLNKARVEQGNPADTNCGEMPARLLFDGHVYTVVGDI